MVTRRRRSALQASSSRPRRPRRRGPRRRRSGRRRRHRWRRPRRRTRPRAARPSSSGRPKPSIAARRSASIVSWGKAARPSAISRARSRCLPGATTSVSRPIASASSASTMRPLRIRSRPRPMPTMRGRRWVPPSISGTPQRRSGKPSLARLGADPQVAPERQLEAAGERVARDRGDRRLRRGQAGEAERPVVAAAASHCSATFGSVAASDTDFRSAPAQKACSSPGQDQDPGLVVGDEVAVALAAAGRPSRGRPRCGARGG